MSKEIAIPTNIPAYAQASGAEAAALVTSQKKNRITLKDAKFIIKKDDSEVAMKLGQAIPVVILGVSPPEPKRTAKVFYEGAWTEGDNSSPDCYSNDGVRPDPSISAPQCGTCAECPHNAWGSAELADGSPGKGKACSDRKQLIVALYQGNGKVSDDVFELSVPPTSLKALSGLGVTLVKHGINMHAIVTAIGVDEDESKQMTFNYLEFLPEAPALKAIARAKSDEIKMMVAPTVGLPAPAAAAQIEVPDYASAVDDAADDEPVEEEVPVKAKKKRAAPAKKAAVVEESDDAYDELSAMLDNLPGL